MTESITVIGGGYVGLVTAICFAEFGHKVTIVDLDSKKVEKMLNGVPPIFELGLKPLLKKHIHKNLFVTTSFKSIIDSNIIFICVGTPQADNGTADLSFIASAATSIGEELKHSKSDHVITVKSTVPPGTTENLVMKNVLSASGLSSDTLGFCMNPEFLREGRAIEDFMNPDRIVIGASDEKSGEKVQYLYASCSVMPIFTSIRAAEMIKYTSNAFLATKISFSNEIGNICKKLGIDVYEVMYGVGLDNRIGSQFLNPGLGFGGSCFPKDVSALVNLAESLSEEPKILQSVLDVNRNQPNRIIEQLVRKIGSLNEKKISILGLAFKDNTDDVRDSRAIPVIESLIGGGAIISAYDPLANENMKNLFPDIQYCSCPEDAVKNADACLVLTEWPEFSTYSNDIFSLMKNPVIIEGRRILTIDGIEGICW